jgi:hypothetical protein
MDRVIHLVQEGVSKHILIRSFSAIQNRSKNTHYRFPPPLVTVSQLVIPAKSRKAGREPGSRRRRYYNYFLDSGSHPPRVESSGMTDKWNNDAVSGGEGRRVS